MQRRVGHQLLLSLKHLLTRSYLERTQAVFIKIIGIDLVDAESRITIPTPTTTKIEFGIDTSDAIVSREDQSEGIILSVTGIGELNLSQQGGEEGTGSPEAIDTQGVIRSILIRPFLMVDQTWW